jgi:Uma2 family endonuclease
MVTPMAPLLAVPEVSERLVRWSVEEYEQLAEQGALPRRAELLRGLIIEKMPKSPLHRALSKRLYDLIQKALPPGFVVFQEAPLRLADSEPEPDLLIVRGAEAEFDERHPSTAALVIEVAVTSASLDRLNPGLYTEAGVEEYWIVLGREQMIEVYHQPVAGAYREVQTIGHEEEELCPVTLSTIRLPLRQIFSA